jgi:hypothetical protein
MIGMIGMIGDGLVGIRIGNKRKSTASKERERERERERENNE